MIENKDNLPSAKSLDALKFIFNSYHPRDFDVRFWDGATWSGATSAPSFTLVINNPAAVRKMFFKANDLSLGEAYIYGDFDIEGELESVFPVGNKLMQEPMCLGKKLRLALKLF